MTLPLSARALDQRRRGPGRAQLLLQAGPDIQGTPASLPVGVPPLLSAHRPGAHVEGQGPRGRGWGMLLLGRRSGLSAEQDRVEAELEAGILDLAAN